MTWAAMYGYTVEKVSGNAYVRYHLTGKRGAVYSLYRTERQPHLMFVVNSHGRVCSLHGAGWFSDRRGVLEPADVR
jgi:hypothetical protein